MNYMYFPMWHTFDKIILKKIILLADNSCFLISCYKRLFFSIGGKFIEAI